MLKKDKKTFVIYLTISFTLLLIAFGLYYFFMVEFDKLESERMIFSSENTLNGSATRSTDTFALDYRLPVEFYNPTDFIVTYTFNGGTPVEITNTSDYVYYDFENRLYLTMTKETMPGTLN